MKRIAIVIAAVAAVFCSCGRTSQKKALIMERDSLLTVIESQTEELDLIKESFESILTSFDSIYVQEGILFVPDEESPSGVYSKKEINKKLDAFQELVERQRNKIDSLSASLLADSVKMNSLNRLIGYLRDLLDAKDSEINDIRQELTSSQVAVRRLNTQVNSMNNTIIQLEDDNKAQLEALEAQDNILNEAFVYIATRKELSRMGVVSTFKKDLSKVDMSQAARVDIRYFTGVAIPSRNAKILSGIPGSSYTLDKKENETILTVTNPAEFWSMSNILVIQY